jgi:hypothetical protein
VAEDEFGRDLSALIAVTSGCEAGADGASCMRCGANAQTNAFSLSTAILVAGKTSRQERVACVHAMLMDLPMFTELGWVVIAEGVSEK